MPHPLLRRRALLPLLVLGLALGACAPAPLPPAPPLPSTASISHPLSSADPVDPDRPPTDPFKRLAWAQRLKERDRSGGRYEIGRALDLIADDLGVVGLLRALPLLDKEDEYDVTHLLHQRADPRAGDALAQSPYADLLFRIGDLRAAKLLTETIASVPTGPHGLDRFVDQEGRRWGMALDRLDSEAAGLDELTVLHPEAREQLRALAEEPALNLAMHYHSASAMRFLAAVGSAKGLAWLRTFASQPNSLAARNVFDARIPDALRALGWAKDEPSFSALVRQLGRLPSKPPGRVPSRDDQGDAGTLASHFSDLGFGAVQGLAEWGDPRAVGPLMKLIEQGTWFDDLDLAACEALAWSVDERGMAAIVAKVRALGARPGARAQSLAACYAATLARRASASLAPAMVDLLAVRLSEVARARVALALGHAGLDAAAEAKLSPMLHNPELRTHAAVALVLGASAEEAARTADTLAAKGPDALREVDARLSELFVSREDLEDGTLFRWVRNGGAVRHVRVDGDRALHVPLDGLPVCSAFGAPHALTKTLVRYRLWQMAHTGPLPQRRAAAATVVWLGDLGPMYALAAEPGEIGDIARAEIALDRTGQDL